MSMLHELWRVLTDSPVFGVGLTLGAFLLANRIATWVHGHPLANPVFLSILLTCLGLALTGVDYQTYMTGGEMIGFLLAPATVALAVPLHREAQRMRGSLIAVLASVVAGATAAVVTGYLVVHVLGGSAAAALSMAPKTATTPVSIAVSEKIGGEPALSAVLTILAGILGAMALGPVLTAARVHDPRVRGLAMGVVSHGIGTSAMLQPEPRAAAYSALAMAITAPVVALLSPLLVAALLMVG